MLDTNLESIDTIYKELRESFNSGKTKSIAWRKNQIDQLYKMCDEQKNLFGSAAFVDFHRPTFETALLDCGSVNF